PEEQAVIDKRNDVIRYARQLQGKVNGMLSVRQSILSKFDTQQVSLYFNNPSQYEKELRQLSNYFFNVNAQYKTIIEYYSNMPTFSYDLDLLGSIDSYAVDKVKKKYLETSQYVDVLNLKHELNKVLKVVMKEDVFYGYEYETKDSYFIKKVNPDYCRISSIEDGVLNYAFNFQYFDSNRDHLEAFPKEFQDKYQQYKANPNNPWLEIPNKGVCFKYHEDLQYAIPPLNMLFESRFDLDEYKKLK